MTTISIAIDTSRFARKLKEAGMPDEQAEAMAVSFAEELTETLTIESDFAGLRSDMRLLLWMVGLSLGFSAIIVLHVLGFI